MPPKPRAQKKPGKPSAPSRQGADRRLLIGLGVAGLAVLVAVAVGVVLASGGGSTANAAAALDSAGCTLIEKPALRGVHSITTPTGTSKVWNTDPPTSGPHYQIPAVWGAYTEPVNMAQLVHNLEHGGIYILYGPNVSDSTVAQLRSFYDGHTRGTILAPLPSLGDQIALGAWTTKSASDPADGTAHLAKCATYDETAFSAFFDQFQFR
ncbi:MAG TPA: DUF3105 domain-containing protein, partial [Gaiella sp.]|nr:DUF3105 domain-containing protein [Gaiella sp.]